MRHHTAYSSEVLKESMEVLTEILSKREAASTLRALVEDLKVKGSSEENDLQLKASVKRVLGGEPVQYITGMAHFYGKVFNVNKEVLIPRPETEELVAEALKYIPANTNYSLWDIGAGSGCISLTIGMKRKTARILASDISYSALKVARENAEKFGVHNVNFMQHDFLQDEPPKDSPFDMLISNPPYISRSEMDQMTKSTFLHEPSAALFPIGQDPLVFYKRLMEIAPLVLKPGGVIMAEINEFRAEGTANLFRPFFQSVTIKNDLQGKPRILVGEINAKVQ